MSEIEKNILVSLVNESDNLTNEQKEVLIDKILNSKGKESFIQMMLLETIKKTPFELIKILLDNF